MRVHVGQTVFAQLMAHLSAYEFQKCVARYCGDSHGRGFSCWDQYLTMAFAQLTYRESLRDIEACLRSMSSKLYHVGFRGQVARSTLADANESHDWRIYADFAQVLIGTRVAVHADGSICAQRRRDACTHWTPPLSICACRCSPGPSSASTKQL